jgi:hypothetical protein
MRYYDTELEEYVAATGRDGRINIRDTGFLIDVAAGLVDGYSTFAMFGENGNIGRSEEDLWSAGGTLIQPTVGEQWEIAAISVSDRFGGIGANVVRVEYLDDNYIEQVEDVFISSGNNPMTATNCFRHIRTSVVSAGSEGTNVGPMILRASGGGNTRGRIEPGGGITNQAITTIPAGKTAFLMSQSGAVGKGDDVNFRAYVRSFDTGVEVRLFDLNLYETTAGAILLPFMIPEKTDLRIGVESSNTGTNASAVYQFVFRDNSL